MALMLARGAVGGPNFYVCIINSDDRQTLEVVLFGGLGEFACI